MRFAKSGGILLEDYEHFTQVAALPVPMASATIHCFEKVGGGFTRADDGNEFHTLKRAFADVVRIAKVIGVADGASFSGFLPGAFRIGPHPSGFAGVVAGVDAIHAAQVATVPDGGGDAEFDGVGLAGGFAHDGANG